MSLWFPLHLNADLLAVLEIQRRQQLDLHRPDIDDVVSTYTVRVDGLAIGAVRHRYGDRAWPLVAAAATLAASVMPELEAAQTRPGGQR